MNMEEKKAMTPIEEQALDQVTGGKVIAIDDRGYVICRTCGKSLYSESEIEEHQKYCRFTYVG